MHDIKTIVKDNKAHFKYLRQGIAYYMVSIFDKTIITTYTFPVPLEDIGEASLLNEDKAMFFMRYIRKAIEDKTISKQELPYDI